MTDPTPPVPPEPNDDYTTYEDDDGCTHTDGVPDGTT